MEFFFFLQSFSIILNVCHGSRGWNYWNFHSRSNNVCGKTLFFPLNRFSLSAENFYSASSVNSLCRVVGFLFVYTFFIGVIVTLPLAEICYWHFGFSLLTDILERYCIYICDIS